MAKNFIDAVKYFGKATSLTENGTLVSLHAANQQKREPVGKIQGLTLHWSAGSWVGCWDDYHVTVAFDKFSKKAVLVKCLETRAKGQHLWGRNTGMYAISFAAMADKSTPVTPEQLQLAGEFAGEACAWFHLDPRGTLTLPKMRAAGSSIVRIPGEIQVPVIHDHAALAKHDLYFPDRWDIDDLLDDVQRIARETYDALKSGKRQFKYAEVFQS